jgi:hypothetical protein
VTLLSSGKVSGAVSSSGSWRGRHGLSVAEEKLADEVVL